MPERVVSLRQSLTNRSYREALAGLGLIRLSGEAAVFRRNIPMRCCREGSACHGQSQLTYLQRLRVVIQRSLSLMNRKILVLWIALGLVLSKDLWAQGSAPLKYAVLNVVRAIAESSEGKQANEDY